ncbi:MAG: glycosyltransferase [Bacteroidetes bacterium]|nr:glycosyltransferase [Bacteroidota bacterium]
MNNRWFQQLFHVIIDDGSKDNCPQILKELQAKYGFKLVFQENHGIAYTLNRGILEYSHGKYFSGCSSDDYWLPDKIEKQVEFMESNRFYPMCFGKTYYVDENSAIVKKMDANNRLLKGGWLFDDIFLFKLHPPVNYMLRTDIYKEVGLYKEGVFAEDYYMNLQIAGKYSIGFLDDYLGFFRYIDTAVKIERFDRDADSHLMVIEGYKTHKLYKKAKTLVYLRKFDLFSGFTLHKKKAFLNLFKSIRLWHNRRFFVACIKFLFYWKA